MLSGGEIRQKIRSKAKALVPEGSEVWLYGSRARGDNQPESDWDILILLDKERVSLDDYDNVSYPLRELGWELGEDINTVLYTYKNWESQQFTPVYKSVTEDRVVLWVLTKKNLEADDVMPLIEPTETLIKDITNQLKKD